MRTAVCLLLLTLLAAPVPAGEEPAPENLSPLLREVLADHPVPALGGAILTSRGLRGIGAAGVRRRGDDTPVTADDVWHLGSCTKAMTATLIGRLVAREELAFDDPILPLLGDLAKDADEGWKAATIAHLLGHRAGAPADLNRDGLWAAVWKHPGPPREARAVLVRGALAHAPESPPGGKHLYSNAGYAIAGAIAETRAGKAFEELLRAEVFDPLGIATAGFGAPGKAGELDQPRGHRADGTAVEPGPRADNPPAIAPAGTVHASLRDWGRFVAAHLAGARGDDSYLPPKVFRRLHTPPAGAEPPYAMGWNAVEREWGGGTVLTHAGSNTMWFAVVWMAPKRDFAVLVTTNQGGEAGAKATDAAASRLIRKHLAPAGPR